MGGVFVFELILGVVEIFEDFLSVSENIFEGIHGSEVSAGFEVPSTVPGPFVFNHSHFSHFLLCF